jgi:hypothetical protein
MYIVDPYTIVYVSSKYALFWSIINMYSDCSLSVNSLQIFLIIIMAFSGGVSSRSRDFVKSESKEHLIKCIKQLVIHTMPYLREAGSYEAAEESLIHMEENDEHFHR